MVVLLVVVIVVTSILVIYCGIQWRRHREGMEEYALIDNEF